MGKDPLIYDENRVSANIPREGLKLTAAISGVSRSFGNDREVHRFRFVWSQSKSNGTGVVA